ncbi:DUF1707 domain-containing protein [Streptomyces sp. NPDC048172]|uniref:DUF1707 SHOCT-like domain-containing protein n=1 Tax=Streptomyces sp. NPDC048172 TaxID=3365505 RepID=UPI003710EEBD
MPEAPHPAPTTPSPPAPHAPAIQEPATRASDGDRDAALTVLAAALAEGRLDQGEYDSRSAAALRAATLGELAPLTADLPAAREQAEAERRAAREREDLTEWLAEWRYWLGGAFLMSAVWGVKSVSDGELAYYWPWMPLAIWAAVLVALAIWPSERDRPSSS